MQKLKINQTCPCRLKYFDTWGTQKQVMVLVFAAGPVVGNWFLASQHKKYYFVYDIPNHNQRLNPLL